MKGMHRGGGDSGRDMGKEHGMMTDRDDLPTRSCVSAGHVQSKFQPRPQSQPQPAQSPILRSQSHSTSRTLARRVVAALIIMMFAGSAVLLGCLAAYAWYRRALADCVEWGNTYRLMDEHVAALSEQATGISVQASRSGVVDRGAVRRLDGTVAQAAQQRRRAGILVQSAVDVPSACRAKQSPLMLRTRVNAYRDAALTLKPWVEKLHRAQRPVAARVLAHDRQAVDEAAARIRAALPGVRELARETTGLRDTHAGYALRVAIDDAQSALDGVNTSYGTLIDVEQRMFAAADAAVRARNAERGIDCGRTACVALTFDDGPRAETSRRVVRTLRDKGDRATFFAIGGAINDATIPVLRDDTRYGMPVGSHTMSHTDLPAIMQAGTERQEFDDASARISEATGRPVNLLRPPHGAADEASRRYLANHLGAGIALYDVDSYDWAAGASARSVQWKVTAQARPGSIILMHDIHEHTAAALPHILDALHAKGYRMVTIDELTGQYPRPGYVYYSRDNIIPW